MLASTLCTELGAADLVVRHLDELLVVDLKNLAYVELVEFRYGELELEMEEEADQYPSPVVVDDDFWWHFLNVQYVVVLVLIPGDKNAYFYHVYKDRKQKG